MGLAPLPAAGGTVREVADRSTQSSSVCERSPRMPLPTSPQFKITLGVQNFLFIIPLILTSFSVLLGVGEGGSKGKFLLLIFTTRSPPKSKATYERWLSLHTQDQKLHLFLTQLLLIPKKQKNKLSEEIMPQSENGMSLWSPTFRNEKSLAKVLLWENT